MREAKRTGSPPKPNEMDSVGERMICPTSGVLTARQNGAKRAKEDDMAITDFKLTEADFASTGAEALPDKVVGQAEYVKSMIDGPSKDVIMPKYNGLIDAIVKELAGALKTSGIQKLNGKFWITQDNTHLRMMQSAPTGNVGGWYIDCHNAATPTFRIAQLKPDGTHLAAAVEINAARSVSFYGNVSSSGTITGTKISTSGAVTGASASITGATTVGGLLSANGGITTPANVIANRFYTKDSSAYLSLGETRGYIRAYCTSFDVADTTGAWRPVRASAFNQQSSERYKKNIVDVDDEELHKVLRVAVKQFMYKSDQEGRVRTGVIAEQLHAIGLTVPVSYDREGRPDAVDYSAFTPYLIGLAQEQERRIDKLESENAALKSLLVSKGLLTQEEVNGLEV